MEASGFVEIVTTLGFPIACVIALGFFVWVIYKQSVAREDKLMTEIASNRIVNEKAIDTLAKYAERLGHIEDAISDIKTEVTVIKDKIN